MAVNDRSKALDLLIILFLLNHFYFYSLLDRYVEVDRNMHSRLLLLRGSNKVKRFFKKTTMARDKKNKSKPFKITRLTRGIASILIYY
jgi:hypothetical protein